MVLVLFLNVLKLFKYPAIWRNQNIEHFTELKIYVRG